MCENAFGVPVIRSPPRARIAVVSRVQLSQPLLKFGQSSLVRNLFSIATLVLSPDMFVRVVLMQSRNVDTQQLMLHPIDDSQVGLVVVDIFRWRVLIFVTEKPGDGAVDLR